MYHLQMGLKKKKSSQNLISFKSYEKSKFKKKQKIHKNLIFWSAIINRTLNANNFWPKQHFG
jgi:hypothetical protein